MKIKITTSNLIIWIALLVYLKPANVVLWTNVNMFYQIIKIFITLVIVFECVKKKIRFDQNIVLCLLFLTVWGISIYLNNGELGESLQELLSIVGLMLLFKCIEFSDKNILATLSIIDTIAKIYLSLELVTIIFDKPLFAEAAVTYDKYFLGSDNYSAFILIPLTGIMFVYSQIKYNKIIISTWFFSIIGFLDLAIPFSVTGVLIYVLMLFLFTFINNPEIRSFFSVKKIVIVVAVFLIAVVGFNIQSHLESLLSLVGKTGLNSREVIWPKVIDAISQKPWIGWGKLSEDQINSYLLYGADHAHNIFLEIILDSGLIGTFIICAWMKEIFKNIKNYKNRYIYLVYMCFGCYVMCGVFDFYLSLIYFWLLMFVIELLKTYAMHMEKK